MQLYESLRKIGSTEWPWEEKRFNRIQGRFCCFNLLLKQVEIGPSQLYKQQVPSSGESCPPILPARSPKPTAEPGFAADTRSQISDADRLGSQTVRQLAAQPPAAEGRGLAREGEVPPPVALVQANLGARPCPSRRFGVVLRRWELAPDLRRQPRPARCFCIN